MNTWEWGQGQIWAMYEPYIHTQIDFSNLITNINPNVPGYYYICAGNINGTPSNVCGCFDMYGNPCNPRLVPKP